MSVTNYWKHFYLNSEGKLRRRKKIHIPRYLRRAKSFSENMSPTRNPSVKTSTFRGWNRSAYFRFRANQDLISQLDSTESGNSKNSKTSQSLPASGYKSIKRSAKSTKHKKLTPGDLLAKLKPQLKGEVVLATSNLVVTRTSPTPEETTPIKVIHNDNQNLKVLEKCDQNHENFETIS